MMMRFPLVVSPPDKFLGTDGPNRQSDTVAQKLARLTSFHYEIITKSRWE